MYRYKAKITKVIDGETFVLDVDLGFSIHRHITAKLLRVQVPNALSQDKSESILGDICKTYADAEFTGLEVMIVSNKDRTVNGPGHYRLDIILPNGRSVEWTYNQLGINKYAPNYSEDHVRDLGKRLIEETRKGEGGI